MRLPHASARDLSYSAVFRANVIMIAASRSAFFFAFASCLPLAGCLVSFEDYPVGNLTQAAGGTAPASGTAGGEAPAPTFPIDDFEDGDNQVLLLAGRDGYWFTSNDGSSPGKQTPDPRAPANPELLVPPHGASTRAMHTTGSGFNIWGALVGLNFHADGTGALPYNVGAYQGLIFSAKLGRNGALSKARLALTNSDTLYGCTVCDDHFGTTVTVGNEFQAIRVPFADLKQAGFGKPLLTTFDATRVYALQLSWTKGQVFDLWIDDISFY